MYVYTSSPKYNLSNMMLPPSSGFQDMSNVKSVCIKKELTTGTAKMSTVSVMLLYLFLVLSLSIFKIKYVCIYNKVSSHFTLHKNDVKCIWKIQTMSTHLKMESSRRIGKYCCFLSVPENI